MNTHDLFDLFRGNSKYNNGYLSAYEFLLHDFCDKPIYLLDIGDGSTEASWKLYFPFGTIVVVESSVNLDTDIKFDIIIDSTTNSDLQRLKDLQKFYQHLKANGLYFIENLSPDSKLVECQELIGCACARNSYFFVGIKTHMCVIHKSL